MTNAHGFKTRRKPWRVDVTSLCRFLVLVGALSVTVAPDSVCAKKPSAGSRAPGGVTLLAHLRLSSGGVGFDDLLYAPVLARLLAPAANAGFVALVEPSSREMTRLQAPEYVPQTYRGGHDEGMTSADSDGTWVFASDRTSETLIAFSIETARVLSRTALGASPDYVRYIPSAREVWVTEPDREQIEIFATSRARDAAPKRIALIKVPGGPESLVADDQHAYTHLWKGKTATIDIKSRQIIETVSNGCEGSRGIALDRATHLLFAGCSEGRVTVLDLKQAGKLIDSAPTGPGLDIIAYNARLQRIYAPSASNGIMAVFSVASNGTLRLLERVKTASGAHCVASDDSTNVWVCDPEKGELLVFGDTRR